MTLPANVPTPAGGFPPDLDGHLTEAEAMRYALLVRNAAIRRRFRALRRRRPDGTRRTVTACILLLVQDEKGPARGLSFERAKDIAYGYDSSTSRPDGKRPWLDAPEADG